MTHSLTPAQLAAGFALHGQRPAAGPLSTLPPVPAEGAVDLLSGTGLVADGRLTAGATALLDVLAAPGRIVTSTVVTVLGGGAATSTFHGPADGGPWVAVATTATGFDIASVGTAAEVAAIVGGYLGLADDPPPLEGGAVELTSGAWSVLAALADIDDPAPSPQSLRRALRRRGPVADAMHTIAPTGAPDPGPSGFSEAANWLDAAGITIQTHDGHLRPTRQGRAVTRALRDFAVAGTVTVDHITEAGRIRVASMSSIRTPERLFFGAWKVGEHGPVIALGEPGADTAATMIRSVVEASAVLPGATPRATEAASPSVAPAPPPPPPPPPPPAASTSVTDPQWIRTVVAAGLVLALIGAIIGLTRDDSTAAAPETTVVTTQVTEEVPADDGTSPLGIVALIAAVGLGTMAVVSWRRSHQPVGAEPPDTG